MSPSAAETLETGALPNSPPKNLDEITSQTLQTLPAGKATYLVTKTATADWLVAVPMLNRPRAKTAGSILTLRPYVSAIGAHTLGPAAKPRT